MGDFPRQVVSEPSKEEEDQVGYYVVERARTLFSTESAVEPRPRSLGVGVKEWPLPRGHGAS